MTKPRSPHGRRVAGLLCLLVAGLALPAQAQPPARRIPLTGAGDAYRISVHPAYVSVLDFPAAIVRVIRSDATRFTVEATDHRVFVRPLEDAVAGTLANLHVITESGLVTVLLCIADRPADAEAHVTFTARPAPREGTPGGELSLSVAAMLGSASFGAHERMLIGGVEAALAYERSAHHDFVAVAAVAHTRSAWGALWGSPYSTPSTSMTSMDHASVVMRLLGGIRLHRGTRVRFRGDLLGGLQTWYMNELGHRVQDASGETVVLPGARGDWRADGLVGASLAVDVAIWNRSYAGLGIRAFHTWRSDAAAFDSIEGVVSLQWP